MPCFRLPSSARLRRTWLLALIAVVFNAAAPVLAYAYGDVMHGAGGLETSFAGEHAGHAGHHGASHRAALPQHSHSTSHCAFCLDFASGAALGSTAVSVDPTPPAIAATTHAQAVERFSRASIRIAQPRAPPASS